MNDVFTPRMRSTQLSEILNNDLKKNYLKAKIDILRFLGHSKRVVQGKRDKELLAEFDSRRKQPIIKVKTHMLLQISKSYYF